MTPLERCDAEIAAAIAYSGPEPSVDDNGRIAGALWGELDWRLERRIVEGLTMSNNSLEAEREALLQDGTPEWVCPFCGVPMLEHGACEQCNRKHWAAGLLTARGDYCGAAAPTFPDGRTDIEADQISEAAS